jgi:threonine dehydrogenase-like Zn-dependent dehydrogenase
MNYLLQSLSTGKLRLQPAASREPSAFSINTASMCSLISTGTERMLLEFGRSSYLEKARQQPDKVKQVLAKIKTDGVLATYRAVKSKLDFPIALGYSNVGHVTAIGSSVHAYRIGDRVVSNGPHADAVTVAALLSAKVPDSVSSEDASFAVPGAIALQGVRLLKPELGECFVVYGLGLLGLLGAQILRSSGSRVLGIDVSAERVATAQALGIEAISC